MEITIKINGQAVSVEVSYEVYQYLCESDRKAENLSHQKRRHWDMRELDEYIIATECTHIHIPTPEEIVCNRETMSEFGFGSASYPLIVSLSRDGAEHGGLPGFGLKNIVIEVFYYHRF